MFKFIALYSNIRVSVCHSNLQWLQGSTKLCQNCASSLVIEERVHEPDTLGTEAFNIVSKKLLFVFGLFN